MQKAFAKTIGTDCSAVGQVNARGLREIAYAFANLPGNQRRISICIPRNSCAPGISLTLICLSATMTFLQQDWHTACEVWTNANEDKQPAACGAFATLAR
jgi:hypothetical protein